MPSTASKDTNDTILALLQEMSKSNKDIVNRIDVLECQQLASSTPLVVKLQARLNTNPNIAIATASLIPQTSGSVNECHRSGQNPLLERVEHIAADSNHEISHSLASNPSRLSEQNLHHDSIVPSLEALQQNATLSQAVSRIMATYDGQARMDAMQGKASTLQCSGHYNTTYLIQTSHIVYDDLSLTQWAVGQLSNIYQMKDVTVSKQALLQVILALKDATSLPWQAVRSAWAT